MYKLNFIKISLSSLHISNVKAAIQKNTSLDQSTTALSLDGAKISVITLGEAMHNAVQLVRCAVSLARDSRSPSFARARVGTRGEERRTRGGAWSSFRATPALHSRWLLLASAGASL